MYIKCWEYCCSCSCYYYVRTPPPPSLSTSVSWLITEKCFNVPANVYISCFAVNCLVFLYLTLLQKPQKLYCYPNSVSLSNKTMIYDRHLGNQCTHKKWKPCLFKIIQRNLCWQLIKTSWELNLHYENKSNLPVFAKQYRIVTIAILKTELYLRS